MHNLDWEVAISKIVDMMIKDQSPNTLVAIRPHLYELITKNIESNTILKKLTFILLNKVDSSLKPKIVEKAAYHVSI
jgi:replication factor C subunit 3/5